MKSIKSLCAVSLLVLSQTLAAAIITLNCKVSWVPSDGVNRHTARDQIIKMDTTEHELNGWYVFDWDSDPLKWDVTEGAMSGVTIDQCDKTPSGCYGYLNRKTGKFLEKRYVSPTGSEGYEGTCEPL